MQCQIGTGRAAKPFQQSTKYPKPMHRRSAVCQPPHGSCAEEAFPAAQGRRRLLAATLLAAGPLLMNLAAPAAAIELPEVFMSSEGFAFDYPRDWVVAFDRSGGRGDGAVTVVGNFRTFDTCSVFRSEVLAADAASLAGGLTEEYGFRKAVEPQQKELSTMRFNLISSSLTPAANGGSYYDYEYQIETCRGEIIEGAGGRVQCLGPQLQELQTLRRHHVGRALLVRNNLYMLNASAPEDRWGEVQATLQGIVGSFRR